MFTGSKNRPRPGPDKRSAALDINKTVTDVFDFIADNVGAFWAKDSPPLPDLSQYDISDLVTDEQANDPAAFYKYSDRLPDIRWGGKKRLPFIDIIPGKFPSPLETPFDVNNTVHVLHYRLRRGRRGRPIVVMINGLHVDTNFYFDWWCWRFAAWGLDSILISMPFSLERVPEGSFSGQYTIVPWAEWTLLAIRQSFMDLQLLVNQLNADGYGAVGTFGASYGALMSGIYVCQADNAHFAILGMPPVDFTQVIHNWSFTDDLKKREAAGEVTMLTDPRLPPIMSMCEMKPHIPTENIFIARGIYDHLVTPESLDRTAAAWGRLPWLIDYPTGHINTFVFNPKFVLDVRRFIHEQIL